MEKTDHASREKVFELLKSQRIAMLASANTEGCFHSRPMAMIERDAFDGELWFFTRASSPKVQELHTNPQVLVSFADPDHQNYVSLSGTGELVCDSAKVKQLWSEPMRTWFPDGTNDTDLALLKVTVEHAEYWDSPSGLMVYAYGYLKATLTGQPPHPGDTAKVGFA